MDDGIDRTIAAPPSASRLASILLIACCVMVTSAIGSTGCSSATNAPADATKPADAKQDASAHSDADHDHGDHDHGEHDHDHGDHGHAKGKPGHPATLAELLATIEATLGSLETAFSKGANDDADTLVHEAGHLLEDGEELVGRLPQSVADRARGAWADLGECLGEVDEKLHAADADADAAKNAYESVKFRLTIAIDTLRDIANGGAASTAP